MSDDYNVDGTVSLDQDGLDALNGTSYKEIVTWGDSLTEGRGAGAGNDYPSILARDFGGARPVINEGHGGATTTEVADDIIAAPDMINDTVVIWAGRANVTDPTQVMADMARIVAALGPNTHYVIMSIDNIDAPQEQKGQPLYNLIMGVNAQLAATYAGHYLDIRSILVNSYDPSSPVDVIDHQNDVVPTSLRIDDGHLNATGNAIVAQNVHDFIASNLDGPPPPRFTLSGTGTITTAAATLDFTGFDTGGNTITTTNAAGTTFTVDNINTALHIVGGPGFDTIIDKSDHLTSAELTAIFGQGIEEIVGSTRSWLAPGANPPPTITGIANDPGESSIDGITDRRENTILGTAFAGGTVSIYSTSAAGAHTLLGTALADQNGAWAFDYTAGSDGSFHLVATSMIAGLGQSLYSNIVPLVIDTVPPAQPSVTSFLPDNSTPGTDGTTVTTAKFRGTAEPTSTVEIYIDGSFVGVTKGRGTGQWVYYNGGFLFSPGQHTISVVAVDVAGNASVSSNPYSFVVGSVTNSAAPVVKASADVPIVKATSAAGAVETFTGSVSDPVDGTSDPIVYTEELADGTTEVVHSGDTFAIGTHTIVASATDSEGNVGTAPPFTFKVVDTSVPATPPAPTLAAASDTGRSSVDGITADATPTFTGLTESGATVTLYEGKTALGHVTADKNGGWSITAPTLADGTHFLAVRVTDGAGNISAFSKGLYVVVDTVAPLAPSFSLATTSDSGRSNTDGVTRDATPTFTGMAEHGATVTLYEGRTALGSVVARADGSWSITAPDLADGSHFLAVRATDAAGNNSTFSKGLFVVVDTTAPAVSISSAGGAETRALQLITGTSEYGSTVAISDNGKVVGTAAVGSDGIWSDRITLSGGANTVVASATDKAGNTGTSDAVAFRYASADAATTSDLHPMIQAASSSMPQSLGAQEPFGITDFGHALFTAALDNQPVTNTSPNVVTETAHATLAAALTS